MEFGVSQPHTGSLQAVVLPTSVTGQWKKVVQDFDPSLQPADYIPANFWRKLQFLHGQATDGCPDVIHAKDDRETLYNLRGTPCNKALLWQTAWVGQNAIDTLNARMTQIYAISFERTPTASHVDPKEAISIAGKFRSFGKSAGQKLKGKLSRNKLSQ